MVDPAIYESLPDDGELAFVVLEEEFRKECDNQIRSVDQNDRQDIFWAEYIAHVQSAVDELSLRFTGIPSIDFTVESLTYSQFIEFRQAVSGYTARLKIRAGRRTKQFSVKLDGNAKEKLRQLLGQIRKAVDEVDISVEKREALFARVTALEAEIDRERTRFDVVAALWLETCGKVGEGLEKLEPLRKWLDPIGGLLNHAKQVESKAPQTLFGATAKPKQITDQRSDVDKLDDDIPF